MRKAVFLDRDGVINRDHGYVFRRRDFEFLPGVAAGLRHLAGAGYALIVVTNQSGIARGFYDEAAFHALSRWMCAELAAAGAPILGVYFCPHHPRGAVAALARPCDCRKPAPGMLLRARADHGIDMAASVMIGDKDSDMAAARAAGVGRAVLISDARDSEANTSEARASDVPGAPAGPGARPPDAVVPDLAAAAALILRGGP